MSVGLSLASDSSETVELEVIMINLGMVTASDIRMQHIYINYIDLDLHSRSYRA